MRAFSLIELIGVLAILTILAALTAPAVIRQMDQAARTKEVSDLNAISNAIVLQIVGPNSTKMIPSQTNWAQTVANWARLPMAKVTKNPRGYDRICLIDTSGWFGTTAGRLPYTQNITGTVNPPVKARLMIVSRIAGPPLPVVSGAPGTIAFDDIWNTADRAKPGTWVWGGSGDDLVIQRMNLEPLFHRLVLVNRDPVQDGKYSIEPALSSTNLPPGATKTSYFLDGTDVTLMLPDGVPQQRILLTRDESYAFSGSRWGGDYYGSGSLDDTAEALAYWAFRFMKAGPAPSAQQGATPEGTVAAMYDFMLVFSLWANKCVNGIHFPQYDPKLSLDTTIPEYMLLQEIAGGGTKADSSFLNDFSGEGGLLNPPPK